MDYVRTVKEVKVFGIFFLNSYKNILKRNWDYRFRKFEQTVISWSSRRLNLLVQKVEVLKIFALSRVYYVASVLPMTKTMGAKFEKLIGKFIWSHSGKLLRVAMNELKLPVEKGGLGLTCIHFMSKSLLLTQLLRLIKHSADKSLSYVDFWIGEILVDLIPDLDQCRHPVFCPAYFQSIAFTVSDAKIQDVITHNNWKDLTNKMVYESFVSSLPAPKVESDAGTSFKEVWKRTQNLALTPEMHEIMYLLIHKKLIVQERLFRINLVNDPYCKICIDSTQMFTSCDYLHFFCDCPSVSNTWSSIRDIILGLVQGSVDNHALISLNFPKSKHEKEVMWLLGSYIEQIWHSIQSEGASFVDKKKIFGFLKFKFRASQLGSRVQLSLPANVFD